MKARAEIDRKPNGESATGQCLEEGSSSLAEHLHPRLPKSRDHNGLPGLEASEDNEFSQEIMEDDRSICHS